MPTRWPVPSPLPPLRCRSESFRFSGTLRKRCLQGSPTFRLRPVYRPGLGTPSDVVHAVMFLCGPESGFITGQNITVDGGMTKRMVYHNDFGWTYQPETKGD
ncbi:MAG: SDR family oxidoreductase [Desulfobacterales bacterium]|nr:SDR family oxidoreductase [Desulfobacterales bacterium]MCF8078873.1 SDR family oxidoreductase [Desulfobacterales bacterium]